MPVWGFCVIQVLNGQQALEEKRAKELASVGWDPTQLPGQHLPS